MVSSVLNAKHVLKIFAQKTEGLTLTNVNIGVILETTETRFWDELEILFKILDPIIDYIKILESDTTSISIVPTIFNSLNLVFSNMYLSEVTYYEIVILYFF